MTEDFSTGWSDPANITAVMADLDLDADDPLILAWKYQNWRELKGIPFMGELAVYPGGGYSAELGVNYDVSLIKMLFVC